jgi:hypothetical protein
MALAIFADRSKQTPSAWAEAELHFDEPMNRGPFTLAGREYTREALDDWADPTISDQVEVFGSQTGKTGMIMAGAAWTIGNLPQQIFWVMPTRDLCTEFAKDRLLPFYRKSPVLAALIPRGRERHLFTTRNQHLGNAIVKLAWAGSPSALSSTPAGTVILDEVDKFKEDHKREANSVNLAEQRTKDASFPKRIKASTPTMTDALIWQEFLKTDQRRRFVPCPHCKKFVVLIWSKEFTVFKKLPSDIKAKEACVAWDKEAARKDGSWDLDRVERSARAECPHCQGHIRDGHKTAMDRAGVWKPTALAARGYRGRHLPSLYAARPETSFGRLAVKFLQAKQSLLGLQGFINGDLAEPWENQDARSERIELVTPADAEPIEGAQKILTADHQLTSPHFWFVIREWNAHSRLIDYGPLDTWEQIRDKQLEHEIADNHVGIDSGHAAEEVYEQCLRWGRMIRRHNQLPLWAGWLPMKGVDRDQPWLEDKTKLPRPFGLGRAALPHNDFRLPLLEFMPDYIKDILARLRASKTPWKWELSDQAGQDEEYFRHLDAEIKAPRWNARTRRVKYGYVKRSKAWPDHLRDAEIEQIVMALFHKLLPLGQELREEPK